MVTMLLAFAGCGAKSETRSAERRQSLAPRRLAQIEPVAVNGSGEARETLLPADALGSERLAEVLTDDAVIDALRDAIRDNWLEATLADVDGIRLGVLLVPSRGDTGAQEVTEATGIRKLVFVADYVFQCARVEPCEAHLVLDALSGDEIEVISVGAAISDGPA